MLIIMMTLFLLDRSVLDLLLSEGSLFMDSLTSNAPRRAPLMKFFHWLILLGLLLLTKPYIDQFSIFFCNYNL